MAAPSGNQFWKMRSKHGRDLIFSSPTILWEASCEYFEQTSQRVWIKKDWVGKDAVEVQRESTPPFTLTGLQIFLDINSDTWHEYKKRKDFTAVVRAIEAIIYTQKFEGAAVGAYNANIIARDLGLAEVNKNDNKHTITSPIIIDWSGNTNNTNAETEAGKEDS